MVHEVAVPGTPLSPSEVRLRGSYVAQIDVSQPCHPLFQYDRNCRAQALKLQGSGPKLQGSGPKLLLIKNQG